MTYSEKLKDTRWQKKRLEILDRDGWKCVGCDSDDKTLHVHHMYYKYGEDPWNTEDPYLITLCEDCHNVIHKFEKSSFHWEDIWSLNQLYNYHIDQYLKNRREENHE